MDSFLREKTKRSFGRTGIICTLGPASSNEEIISQMVRAGMDVARLNFSHGRPTELQRKTELVRRLNARHHGCLKILGDLQGHRIRIGKLVAPLELKKGATLWLTRQEIAGNKKMISFDYQGSLRAIKNGHQIFIDDGNICLEVTGRARGRLRTKVIAGGPLREHKGVNIPEARLDFGGIGRKDLEDIAFCEKYRLEYIAQSFVRSAGDILAIRQALGSAAKPQIIAKIENREGIRNIDRIIAASDGIMIARGDLGVSLPIYQIPLVQKMIIRKCNRAKKFVITATQMLESMTANLRPTRAEVTDVANAIIDGTDFVMLSAETAVGKYPVATVAMMKSIVKYTEDYLQKP